MWQKTGFRKSKKAKAEIMRKHFVFSGASLCFGRTETLLCEAKQSRWSNQIANSNDGENNKKSK
ncbi:hypothetical protein FACS189440_08640 [Bacteroidia bacterium]|nr:hypothetical protein FACS189423_10530 [Bacteroidia bacterium]GHT47614.1 hypothetical protein FACS189440_08640 [Bacteroidia bacterium]